jgi:histidine ammonia-lyase
LTEYVIKNGQRVSLETIAKLAIGREKVSLDSQVRDRVTRSRQKLQEFVEQDRVIYGVNTSMGGFVDHLVPVSKAQKLQENLLNAVATNVGAYVDDVSVKAIMLSRIVSLGRGNSAISLENLDKLVAVYNSEIIPCVPEKGSLGTSGDLGPLASIALVCIGQWKAKYRGQIMLAAQALELAGIDPMQLSYKEGLALVNGTSGMVVMAAIIINDSKKLLEKYIKISALSFEGLKAKSKPFDPRVHMLKPHKGQLHIATELFNILSGSKLAENEADIERALSLEMNETVQAGSAPIEDAYSIRCTPQILGPIFDNLEQVEATVENELNSSNDNPLILPDEDEVFHNGHFHGQYVAMAMDQLCISLVTLTNLANRRIDRFLDKSNSNGLPAFLCKEDPGLRLGLMGGQFMTASITAESRSLCVPMSIQSLTSTGDFQDIVSFGFVAARRARDLLNNSKYVIAFELVCACQAVDIRGKDKASDETKKLYNEARKIIPYLNYDVTLTDYIENIKDDVLTYNINHL